MSVAVLHGGAKIFGSPKLVERWLELAIAAGDMGAFLYDVDEGLAILDPVLIRLTGLNEGADWFEVDRFFDRMHADDTEMVREKVAATVAGQGAYSAEYRFTRLDGTELWLSARGDMVTLEDGRQMLAGIIYDNTAAKMAELRAGYLAEEMAHRVRNLISVARGMSRLTARHADSLDQFLLDFDARLNALAAVNSADFARGLVGVSASALVETALAPFDDETRIVVNVPDVTLSGSLAQILALMLHELATNAMKHGALVAEEGRVRVDFNVSLSRNALSLVWQEISPGKVALPEPSGFGHEVLMKMATAIAQGQPGYQITDEGLRYSCTWKLTAVLAESGEV